MLHAWDDLPRTVRAAIEAADWLLLGFEHITGHHADLSPGSPDLPMVADTVSTMSRELHGCPAPNVPALTNKMAWMSGWRRLQHRPPAELDQWSLDRLDLLVDWEARGIEAVAGDSLLRTDDLQICS